MPWSKDSTESWMERFEALARSMSVVDTDIDTTHPNSKLTDLFLTVIGRDSYAQLKSLLAPESPTKYTYKDIKEKIEAHLKPRTIEIAERYKFHQVSQNSDSVSTFITRLRHAAETCNFGTELDSMLRDRFVLGLNDEAVVKKLLLEDSLTFDKAVQIAATSEEVKSCQAVMRSSNNFSSINRLQSGRKKSVNSNQSRPQQTDNKKISYNPKFICKFCATNHQRGQCPAYGKICNKCKRKNHYAKCCKATVNSVLDNQHVDDSLVPFQDMVLSIGSPSNKMLVDATLNGIPSSIMIDSGASRSLLPISLVKRNKSLKQKLIPYRDSLISYTGNQVQVLYILKDVHLRVGGKEATVEFLIVKRGQPIIGMDIISEMNLLHLQLTIDKQVNQVSVERKPVRKIEIRAEAQPRFCKPRKLPYALETPVRVELDRLVASGVIQKVESSDWATPVVVVHKPNGKVRLCGDYQMTLNPYIPSSVVSGLEIDDTLSKLGKCTLFSKIDLTDAYLQVKLDEGSQMLTVISTPFGLFKYLSLPFGIKSAPYIFQSIMLELTKDLPNVHCHLDDILIATSEGEDHRAVLNNVKQRLKMNGFPINEAKSCYFQKKIRHLGYLIEVSSQGTNILPDPSKVEDLLAMPEPQDVAAIQRFIGCVGFYAKFIDNFSDTAKPLRDVVTSNHYKWTESERNAFRKLKLTLIDGILCPFNPADEIELICDASPTAVGAVMQQNNKPVLYISKTLSPAERNYSQLDREGLAIVYAVRRLHKYVYGRKFTIVTDHKPLEFLFKPDGCRTSHANQRVLRWAVFLASYDYEIVGKRTGEIPVADMLSRIENKKHMEQFDIGSIDMFYNPDMNLRREIIKLFESSKEFAKLKNYVRFGWPRVLRNLTESMRPYYHVRDELSFHNNLLYRGNRLVIPRPLRMKILQNLHSSHLGIVKLKALARERFWWPAIDRQIEDVCRHCSVCSSLKAVPKSLNNANVSWPDNENVFDRIHVDFAGPVENHYLLIIVDAYSRYPFVVKTNDTSTRETVNALKNIFAMFGIPKIIVADNGPAFRSEDFMNYMRTRGIQVWHTPVGHPQSNGVAERFVGNLKLHLKATVGKGDFNSRLQSFLLQYRNAKIASQGRSPAEAVFSFKPRMPMNLVQPEQPILFKKFSSDKTSTFEPGVVISTTGKTCINIKDKLNIPHTRHLDQVKIPTNPVNETVLDQATNDVQENPESAQTSTDNERVSSPVPSPRRSTRERRKPEYLEDFET